MAQKRCDPIRVELTERVYKIVTEFGVHTGGWHYDPYNRRWFTHHEMFTRTVRLVFAERELSFENCRAIYMIPRARDQMRFESTVEEIREAGAVGAWEYDMDTMEERECDGDESGEVFRVMREDA